MLRRVCTRISPIDIERVRERHVSHAERGELPEHAEIVVDHVAALNSHEDGDFPLLVGAANFVRGCGEN